MLARAKLELCKGKLASYKSEIGKRFRRQKMASKKGEEEDQPMSHEEIRAMLQSLKETIDDLEWTIQRPRSRECSVKGEGGGEGSGPSELPSPSSSSSLVSSEASKYSSHRKNSSKKIDHNLPLLKLDVKFELSTYDGELNDEKLNNWINQIELYCRVQRIMDEAAKIQLVAL
jgi:hypothetical protein